MHQQAAHHNLAAQTYGQQAALGQANTEQRGQQPSHYDNLKSWVQQSQKDSPFDAVGYVRPA